MERYAAVRRGASLVLAVFLSFTFAAIPARPSVLPQRIDEPCLTCHADKELESSAGIPVFVDPKVFAESVHGRAGKGCTGCHADLAGFEDFPHAAKLAPVTCARCHSDYGRPALAGVHALSSPSLVARPVLCKDCHGYHDVLPSSHPLSALHAANRPATCAKCHAGAGPNYSRGRVHELEAAPRSSAAGVVGVFYRIFIGLMAAFFFSYVAIDLLRRGRER